MDEDILTIMRIIVARMDGKIKDLGRFKGPMAFDARIILFSISDVKDVIENGV